MTSYGTGILKGACLNMNRPVLFIAILTVAVMPVLLLCNNPLDDPPLTWRTKVAVPMTNDRFIIGEEFDNLFSFEDDDVEILNVLQRYYDDPSEIGRDTVRGDTVVFSAAHTDTSEFESHEDTLDAMEFRVSLGPLGISGAPSQNHVVPVLHAAGQFEDTVRLTLEKIYSVKFYDTVLNVMPVTLHNSGSVGITDVHIGIVGIDTASVGTLDAGDHAVANLNLAGAMMGHTALFYVAGNSDSDAAKEITIGFTMTGLIGEELRVEDSAVAFSKEFVNAYELSDTIDVDYIDIGEGFFRYSMMNYSGVDFFVQGIHRHMWMSAFCEDRNITRYEELANVSGSDSAGSYFGNIIESEGFSFSNREITFGRENISNCRLFSEWDESLGKSVTKVGYLVSSVPPVGKIVTMSAHDSLMFTVSASSLKFRELMGTMAKAYDHQSDTQMVAINLPWNNSVKDSLRGRFFLENVWGDIMMRTALPGRSFLDTLRIDFIAYSPDSTTVRDSTSTALNRVGNDSTFIRSIDITDVANSYSDSVAIVVNTHIPQGTRMRVVNDLMPGDPDYQKYLGRMIINVSTLFRLNAKLDWEVFRPVNMDLGSSRFKMDDAMRYVEKLDDRSAVFEMWLRNSSNLNLSLFALVAADALMDTLDSLTMNEVHRLIQDTALARQQGYINLFGNSGISVWKRNAELEKYTSIRLSDWQLQRLCSADSLNFRWWARFNEQERDAMSDTDYVNMKSRLTIDGNNNTDSLIIWE